MQMTPIRFSAFDKWTFLKLLAVFTPLSLGAQPPGQAIRSVVSDQCLQPLNGSLDLGAAVVQQPCTGNSAQQWFVIYVNNSPHPLHYQNRLTGLCLDARGSATNGTPVQQWTCNKISNENWDPGGELRLISRISGTRNYCLDVPGGKQVTGLAVQIYVCNGTVSQQWHIE